MGMVGRGSWLSEAPSWWPLPVSINDRAVLAPVSKFRIVLTVCQAFMGSDKPSSLVTILSNYTSLDYIEGE
jgi:hypothetical protein